MSKRYEILQRAVVALCMLLAVAVLTVSPAYAADEAAPAKPAKADKVKKEHRAEPAAAAARPATPAKPPRAAKPPRPPEKSLEEQRAEDGPWAKHSNWLSFRAGYAKATGENAGDGLVGYGMAYQHMIDRQWGFGFAVQHDLVGHLGPGYEISVPFTLEINRHFKWNTSIRPYVGLGGGYFFHKFYRTAPDDTGAPSAGGYVNVGANLPLSERHVLGLDTRVAFVGGRDGVVNPVFGPEKSSRTLWSVKLNYALVY